MDWLFSVCKCVGPAAVWCAFLSDVISIRILFVFSVFRFQMCLTSGGVVCTSGGNSNDRAVTNEICQAGPTYPNQKLKKPGWTKPTKPETEKVMLDPNLPNQRQNKPSRIQATQTKDWKSTQEKNEMCQDPTYPNQRQKTKQDPSNPTKDWNFPWKSTQEIKWDLPGWTQLTKPETEKNSILDYPRLWSVGTWDQ